MRHFIPALALIVLLGLTPFGAADVNEGAKGQSTPAPAPASETVRNPFGIEEPSGDCMTKTKPTS
ncbi:MAG: hypothetical protein VW268_00430 [Rhodospirillaceae bacterium]